MQHSLDTVKRAVTCMSLSGRTAEVLGVMKRGGVGKRPGFPTHRVPDVGRG